MELRILCKHLVAEELNGKFTVGEDSADIIGITLPRFYEHRDLSQFSFRITAVGKCKNTAVQILNMDDLNDKTIHLLWTVTSEFTSIPEEFTLVLTGVNPNNSVTIKFKSCSIAVNSDKMWEFLPSPELSEQLLNRTHNEIQKAIDAANRAEKASQTPAPAEIYPATTTRLGGVKVDGKTITASEDGTISAVDSETLKTEIANVKSSQKSISSLAVQIAHPNNFLIYDNAGKPSVMVAIPKFYLDEVIDGASHTVHPAFIINGIEQDIIYISKYQNILENGRAYSLPMKDPAVNINFEQAWQYCKNKGAGWHLMTNAEWAAIALWCKKNGTLPKGNNNYGQDIWETDLPPKAIPTSKDSGGRTNRVLTGSGNADWYHDNTFSGISDLNGNIWEWNSGLRLKDGEIQVLADNNAADWNNSVSSDSTLWKAIKHDGSLVVPGTDNTLKYDRKNNKWIVGVNISSQSTNYYSNDFKTLTADNNITIPEILKALVLYPADPDGYGEDGFYAINFGERLLLRGGNWSINRSAGIFHLSLTDSRSFSSTGLGFRCAYCQTASALSL